MSGAFDLKPWVLVVFSKRKMMMCDAEIKRTSIQLEEVHGRETTIRLRWKSLELSIKLVRRWIIRFC